MRGTFNSLNEALSFFSARGEYRLLPRGSAPSPLKLSGIKGTNSTVDRITMKKPYQTQKFRVIHCGAAVRRRPTQGSRGQEERSVRISPPSPPLLHATVAAGPWPRSCSWRTVSAPSFLTMAWPLGIGVRSASGPSFWQVGRRSANERPISLRDPDRLSNDLTRCFPAGTKSDAGAFWPSCLLWAACSRDSRPRLGQTGRSLGTTHRTANDCRTIWTEGPTMGSTGRDPYGKFSFQWLGGAVRDDFEPSLTCRRAAAPGAGPMLLAAAAVCTLLLNLTLTLVGAIDESGPPCAQLRRTSGQR